MRSGGWSGGRRSRAPLADFPPAGVSVPMNKKIAGFLADRRPETPCLVVDLDVIEDNYLRLAGLLPLARIFYAVKANPMPAIVERLAALGSGRSEEHTSELQSLMRI